MITNKQYIKKKNSIHFIQKHSETYGIGGKRVAQYCFSKGVNPLVKNAQMKLKLNLNLEKKFKHVVSSVKLREFKKKSLEFFWSIRIYKGFRYKFKLPSRGQRTHTNAKTKKRIKAY